MNDFDKIIAGEKPTLVDFYATWCGPCKMQSPILEQLKQKVADDATILKVDVDANPDLAARYQVRSIPTLIVFKNGEALWRAYGVQQLELLYDKVMEHVGPVKKGDK